MAHHRLVKAAGGDGDGRAALPRDSLESMEFITLTYFLSPPEEHLLRRAAPPPRIQPPAEAGARHRAWLARCWGRKPPKAPPGASPLTEEGGSRG